MHAAFVLACAAVVVACALLTDPWRNAVTAAASAAATAAVVVRLRRRTVPDLTPFRVLALGVGTLCVHNLEGLRWAVVLNEPVSRGLFHGVTLPLGYGGILAAALLGLLRFGRRDVGGIVESGLLGITTACLVWATVVSPALSRAGADGATRFYELVLLLLIAGIGGALVRGAVVMPGARPALAYLSLGIAATLSGNLVRILTTDPVTGAPSSWNEVAWSVANLAVGAAGLHPALARLPVGGTARRSRLSTVRVTFLGVALSVGPALVAAAAMRGDPVDVPLLLVGTFLVVLLVMLRVAGLARRYDAAEAELARSATRDELTALPNRRAIDLHLAAALDRVAERTSAGLVVAFLDLDGLKPVNDQHGHEAGDRLIAAVAGRLQGVVRDGDLVGRFGGDEFVVVVEGDPERVWPEVLGRIRGALAQPVVIGDLTASAAASIGCATVRAGQRTTASHVLALADARMYEHKRATRTSRAAEEGRSPEPEPVPTA